MRCIRDVPASAVVPLSAFDLPETKGELEVERVMARMAARNVSAGSVPFFCGAGAYRHHVPSAVDHLIQRSEFLTSYTPYQPEIAQGTLQFLFEFQTQVALLTGMEVANASLYDGSTATAEAVLMAQRLTRRPKAILSGGLHPHYAETVETVAALSGKVVRAPVTPGSAEDIAEMIDSETACVVVQSPDVFGLIRDIESVAAAAHAKGALLIAVVTEAMSLGLLESPGAQGADIVAAEGQSIGNGLNFGGPYVGLFATREKFLRQMPGRLTGETVDADGRRGFVLTLSTREQHIRPRQGDEQYLHQFGAVLSGFHHPSLAARRGGIDAPGAAQPRACVGARRASRRRQRRDAGDRKLLQRVHDPALQTCGVGRRCAGGEGHRRRRSRLAPDAARQGARLVDRTPPPKPTRTRTSRPSPARSRRCCHDHEPPRTAQRAGHRRGQRAAPRSPATAASITKRV